MRMLTYGTLPTRQAFDAAFEAEVPDKFEIRLSVSDARAAAGTIIGDDEYTSSELYKGVRQLIKKWEAGDDNAGDLASSILEVLGFEWV